MREFPLFLRLEGKPVLLVGGGEAASAKLRLLLAAGAQVTLIADCLNPEMTRLQAEGAFSWRGGVFAPTDAAGHVLVIGATGDAVEDRAIAQAARRAGVWVNIVDRPELSDFLMPAIIDRGEIVVAISTAGASPVLAQRLRGLIEGLLPARLGDLAVFARRFREAVRRRIVDSAARRAFWAEAIDGPIGAAVLAGKPALAARHLIRRLNGEIPAPAGEWRKIAIAADDPDRLTLGDLKALGQADIVIAGPSMPRAILDFARRDAARYDSAETAGPDIAGRRVVELVAASEAIVARAVS